jgi:Icc-related predicted phosphoesterase
MIKPTDRVRIAAVADLHFGRPSYSPPLRSLFDDLGERADVLALCGDLTDSGDPEEARGLARVLATSTVPTVAVLGNHDYESGKMAEVSHILSDAGVHILDGSTYEVRGIGFAGVKGFAGGFGRRALGPWGEEVIKLFVQESLNEALKLETALARIRAERRVVLMHYSPVESTVEGEPKEIYPYLGSSRLEEPLTRYPVDAVFHGHAHHGALEGRTKTGVPVYNVSINLLTRVHPEGWPFRLLEIPVNGGPPSGGPAPD